MSLSVSCFLSLFLAASSTGWDWGLAEPGAAGSGFRTIPGTGCLGVWEVVMEAAAGMLKAVRLGLSFDPTIVQWWCLCHFPLCMKKGDKTRTSFFGGGAVAVVQVSTGYPSPGIQWTVGQFV